MDTLSDSLIEADKEMKKARWIFDGSVRANASRKDQDELWDIYKSFQDSVEKIQNHLEFIGKAKADVARARWWLDVGVYSESSLSLVYPLDSPRILKMRLDEEVEKARIEYNRAALVLELLLAPVTRYFDPWLEQERQRVANSKVIPQETKSLIEEYLIRGQQRRVNFKDDVNHTVSRCKQKVRAIKNTLSNRPY
jgi:hypothetical protein